MAKKKYEVIVKGMTVFGAHNGQIIELDEELAAKYLAGRYIAPSRKHSADLSAEATPTVHKESDKQPKQKAKKQPEKSKTAPTNPAPENTTARTTDM